MHSSRPSRDEDCVVYAHVGGRWADLEVAHDESLERAVEIHSAWGTFEWLVHDAFRLGHRVGIVANSDGHKGRPGASWPGAATFGAYGGLTAFVVSELTRDAVFDAIRARRTYATTGCRLDLQVSVALPDGTTLQMGEEATVDRPTVEMAVEVHAGAPIDRVEFRRGRQTVHVHRTCLDVGDRVALRWEGAQYRGRGRQVTWDGEATLTGGSFGHLVRINAFNPDHAFEVSATHLRWQAVTTGNFGGFDVVVREPEARLHVTTAHATLETSVGELGVGARPRRRRRARHGPVGAATLQPQPPPQPTAARSHRVGRRQSTVGVCDPRRRPPGLVEPHLPHPDESMTEDTLWIPMIDGVRLDASVCIPDTSPPFPAVVLVHGHGEDGSKASTLPRARRLAGRGLLCVCYSVRGQGGSEGLSFHLGAQEIFDLQTVVEHVRDQLPVDPDRVAVAGSSQGGWHSWMAAAFCPGLATVVPENIFVDYADFAVPCGALSTWFFTRTMRRRVMTAGLQDLARDWAIAGDWERLRAWLQPMSPRLHARQMACPVLCIHGWHDVGMPANDLLAMMPELPGPARLHLGGGGHDGQDAQVAADARTARVDAWLDHWLLGTPLPEEPAISWVERPAWIPRAGSTLGAGSEPHTLYLQVDSTLAETAPTAPAANHNVNHQPRDPAYTLAVALHHDLADTLEAWPREEARFDGAPLTSDLVLQGIPQFSLHVLPSRPFGQVHAELHDVAPDGSSTLVTRGHQGFRNATAGSHTVLHIDGRAIAYRVRAGHRLRVVVTDQCPAYVVPVYRPWRARLYCETGRASYVTLPIRADSSVS